MNAPDLDSLRFPIGPPQLPTTPLTPAERVGYLQQLVDLPLNLMLAARQVGRERLQLPYRPGGWTGLQVIHHVADSHLNAYVRFRLALTEDNPTIKPYAEAAWAELPDAVDSTPSLSLELLAALHNRWAALLHHLTEAQWQRTFYHPGNQKTSTLEQTLALYAWHGRHHVAHVELLAAKHQPSL